MATPLTSEQLFDALAESMEGRSDLMKALTNHVREVTGGEFNTLFALQGSAWAEEKKIALWKECMSAIVNKTTHKLKGTEAKGQAASPEPEKPAPKPAAKPAAKPEPAAPKSGPNQKPATSNEKPVEKSTQELLEELLKRMAAQQAPAVQPAFDPSAFMDTFLKEMDKFRTEIDGRVSDYCLGFREGLEEKLAAKLADFAVTFKLPPRDVVEIRKWDGSVKEIGPLVHKQFKQVMEFVTARNARGFPIPLWVYGSPGSGKTHLGSQMAEALGAKYYPFSFGPTTTEGRLVGFNSLSVGTYVAGLLYEPYKNGGLFLGDEIDSADPGVPIAMNSINSNESYMFPNGELASRHPNFFMVMCANSLGTGSINGFVRNKLDAATLDRPAFLELKYDHELEVKLCGDEKWAAHVHRVREYVSKNSGQTLWITPRCSINGAALLANGVAPEVVENATIYKLASADIRTTIRAAVGNYSP